MRGTPAQAAAYSSKDDTRCDEGDWNHYQDINDVDWFHGCGPFKHGELPKVGRRSDLVDAGDLIKAGGSITQLALEHTSVFIRYNKGFNMLKFYVDGDNANKWREVAVHVIWGPTGVGKTREAIEKAREAGPFYILQKDENSRIWWDGYEGQKTVIFDDFDGSWYKYRSLLRILDGNGVRCQIKGGTVWATFTTVYITCPVPPEEWYMKSNITEMMRRITSVVKMGEGGEGALAPMVPGAEVGVILTPPLPVAIAPGPPEPIRRSNAMVGLDLLAALGAEMSDSGDEGDSAWSLQLGDSGELGGTGETWDISQAAMCFEDEIEALRDEGITLMCDERF